MRAPIASINQSKRIARQWCGPECHGRHTVFTWFPTTELVLVACVPRLVGLQWNFTKHRAAGSGSAWPVGPGCS